MKECEKVCDEIRQGDVFEEREKSGARKQM